MTTPRRLGRLRLPLCPLCQVADPPPALSLFKIVLGFHHQCCSFIVTVTPRVGTPRSNRRRARVARSQKVSYATLGRVLSSCLLILIDGKRSELRAQVFCAMTIAPAGLQPPRPADQSLLGSPASTGSGRRSQLPWRPLYTCPVGRGCDSSGHCRFSTPAYSTPQGTY